MNCQEITDKIISLKEDFIRFGQFLDRNDIAEAKRIQSEMNVIFEILPTKEMRAAIEKNQQMYDWLFAGSEYEGKLNLRHEYIQGNIHALTEEEMTLAREQGLTEMLIVPGQISRDKVIDLSNQKYATIRYDEGQGQEMLLEYRAQRELSQTLAAQEDSRPRSFYMLALRPGLEIIEAHPESFGLGFTPGWLLTKLQEAQEANPQLNLRGLTLPEYLLFDAYQFCRYQHHLNEQSQEYLLAEIIPNTIKALAAEWSIGDRRVKVASNSFSGSTVGARFVAVAQGGEADNPGMQP